MPKILVGVQCAANFTIYAKQNKIHWFGAGNFLWMLPTYKLKVWYIRCGNTFEIWHLYPFILYRGHAWNHGRVCTQYYACWQRLLIIHCWHKNEQSMSAQCILLHCCVHHSLVYMSPSVILCTHSNFCRTASEDLKQGTRGHKFASSNALKNAIQNNPAQVRAAWLSSPEIGSKMLVGANKRVRACALDRAQCSTTFSSAFSRAAILCIRKCQSRMEPFKEDEYFSFWKMEGEQQRACHTTFQDSRTCYPVQRLLTPLLEQRSNENLRGKWRSSTQLLKNNQHITGFADNWAGLAGRKPWNHWADLLKEEMIPRFSSEIANSLVQLPIYPTQKQRRDCTLPLCRILERVPVRWDLNKKIVQNRTPKFDKF